MSAFKNSALLKRKLIQQYFLVKNVLSEGFEKMTTLKSPE